MLYRGSGRNKMAPLASILCEREQQVARSSLFLDQWPEVGRHCGDERDVCYFYKRKSADQEYWQYLTTELGFKNLLPRANTKMNN